MNFTKQLRYCLPVFDSVSPSILPLRCCFWCIGVFLPGAEAAHYDLLLLFTSVNNNGSEIQQKICPDSASIPHFTYGWHTQSWSNTSRLKVVLICRRLNNLFMKKTEGIEISFDILWYLKKEPGVLWKQMDNLKKRQVSLQSFRYLPS